MKNTRWSAIAGKDVEATTSEQAIQLSGLNWDVLQSPVFYKTPTAMVENPHNRVNFRSDTHDILGIVSDSYKILQNRDAFRFLDSLIGVAEAMYVNVGSFRNGARVYIQAKLPGFIRFDDGGLDVGEKFLTFITSHDGSLPISALFTPIRVICQNTLLMALRDNVRKSTVRHTLNLAMGLQNARETLGILNNQFTLLEDVSRKLTHVSFAEKDIPQLLTKSGLIPAEADPSSRAKNIMEEVLLRFKHGAGSELASAKGTAWGAYNAVVEYVDHYRGTNPLKRAESSVLGSGANIKEKALELLASI